MHIFSSSSRLYFKLIRYLLLFGCLISNHLHQIKYVCTLKMVFDQISKHLRVGRGKRPNAERRMHCLLAVSFICVCLRLAFICWKGSNTIKCCTFQQIKANRKKTQVKLTASKQCIRRSAFGVLPLPPPSS